MKLRSLAEGAQLATRHFLQQSAPVPCPQRWPRQHALSGRDLHLGGGIWELGDFMIDRWVFPYVFPCFL